MYYLAFKNRDISEELHILLAPDEPRINFKNGKSLKDHLVRSSHTINVAGHSGLCGGKSLLVSCKSEILTKFITFTNHLISILKTQYIL